MIEPTNEPVPNSMKRRRVRATARRLATITVERPRCPCCNGVRLRKYRSVRDQGDGSTAWWGRSDLPVQPIDRFQVACDTTRVRDGYAHRVRAIGHLREAEDESHKFLTLHAAICAARKANQTDGTIPRWEALAEATDAVRQYLSQ